MLLLHPFDGSTFVEKHQKPEEHELTKNEAPERMFHHSKFRIFAGNLLPPDDL
jgi:hypothetical protein